MRTYQTVAPQHAQQTLAAHAVTLAGQCAGCDEGVGCTARLVSLAVIGSAGQLPRRARGASRPELIERPVKVALRRVH